MADAALASCRTQLLSKGSYGIRGLAIVFRRMNSIGGKRLDKRAFIDGMTEYGVKLSPAEFDAVFKAFDRDGDNTISYEEFLVGLRGTLNESRRAWVDKAFAKMDKDGSGVVNTTDLRGTYSAAFHPKVKLGEMTEEEAFREFLDHLDVKTKDGQITKDEFVQYYADLSASVDSDDYWAEMMQSAWKL